MNNVTVNMKLYGILSRYMQNAEFISVEVPAACSYQHLTENLYQALIKNNQVLPEKSDELKQLITSSALAINDEMLDENIANLQLQSNALIAVLPPVCGG